ncbi:MAG: glycosyltransferase family 1 protein, partial [Candidatus Falkowbacteria bacterium]|nr:glycosyltransferase family 1 protein [Candidatus Falkowbacteria bacterium]
AKISADKIVLSYEGVTSLKAGEKSIKDFSDEKILMCYNIKHPYLLYVGNAYPHKNLETLLNVFKQLVDNRYQKISLVLIGKEDYFYKKIKEHAQKIRLTNDQVVFPGYVSDNELASFYKNALSYVFPSLYEGFGLPPLEAMSMGCPVLSSSLTSMPEVLEDAALFFDPQDEKDFLKKMNIIIIDDQLRKSLVIKGLALIKKYSWDKCAMITYDSYINSFIE